MSTVKYSEDHEYIRLDGDTVVIGVTDHAQEQLGDVVFVDLPDVGKTFAKGDEVAVIESVKAAAELYSPVSGEVVEVNGGLEGDPATVNRDAMGEGWFVKIKLADASELDGLMDEDAYKAFVEAQG